MAWIFLAGSTLLLTSLTRLEHTLVQAILLLIFALTGIAYGKRKLETYMGFVFLYPLLPSQAAYLFPVDLLEFLLLCLIFWWAVTRIFNRDQRLPSSTLNLVIGCLILIFCASVLISLIRGNYIFSKVFWMKLQQTWNVFDLKAEPALPAVRSLIYMLEGAAFFYLTFDLVRREQVGKVVWSILYSCGLVSLIGILQRIFKFKLLDYWLIENPNITRINATFSDPNSLGSYLAAVICLAIFCFAATRVTVRTAEKSAEIPLMLRRLPCITIVLLGVMLSALVLSASRAGWAATLITLVFLPLATKWTALNPFPHLQKTTARILKRAPVLAVGLLILLFVVAGAVNYTNPRPNSLVNVVLFTFNPQLSANDILKGRLDVWNTALDVFTTYPVFGAGFGSLRALFNAPYFLPRPENAHNYFLQLLAETGIIGFLAFCTLLILVFVQAKRKFIDLCDSEFLLHYGLFAGLVAFLLTSLTGHPLLLLKLQLIFWGFIGLLLSVRNFALRPERSRTRPVVLGLFASLFAVLIVTQSVETVRTRKIAVYEYGYHEWERDDLGTLFRWTSGEAISIFDLQGEVLALELRQLDTHTTKDYPSVKVFVNDTLIDTITFYDHQWKSLRYVVKHLAVGNPISVKIVPNRVFTPERDNRKLGVMVQKIRWLCSTKEPLGVYELEREGDRMFYWTRTQASFPLQRIGNTLQFQLLPHTGAQTEPLDVHFYWDSLRVSTFRATQSVWQPVQIRLPHDASAAGFLTIHVSKTINLKKLKLSDDLRDLGVRVEWPFHWSGPPPKAAAQKSTLTDEVMIGVANNGNHPVRLFEYRTHGKFGGRFRLFRSGDFLEPSAGLRNYMLPDNLWQRLFSVSPLKTLEESFVLRRITVAADLPPGPVMIRVKAFSSMVGNDPALIRLLIDNKEFARQPILFERWTYYYFSENLPKRAKMISFEFLNDEFKPEQKRDRNLFIAEISVAPKKAIHQIREGWEVTDRGVIVAEAVDREFPFQPGGYCYTIDPQ